MQKITIIGRLGRDAAIREMQDGSKVISFTVAVNGRSRGVEKTSWYDVSSFNYERYKNMAKYLSKGSSVVVVGELDCDIEDGKDGVTRCRRSVIADYIDFNSNGNTSGSTDNSSSTVTTTKTTAKTAEKSEDDMPRTKKASAPAAAPAVAPQNDDDELPF